jgi:N-acetylmuramoyl-L-alanine amidase
VPPAPPNGNGVRLSLGANGDEVHELQRHLAGYGYGVPTTGDYDEATRDVVAAFQRHFRPARIDGEADESTRKTLAALIEKLHRSETAGGPGRSMSP